MATHFNHRYTFIAYTLNKINSYNKNITDNFTNPSFPQTNHIILFFFVRPNWLSQKYNPSNPLGYYPIVLNLFFSPFHTTRKNNNSTRKKEQDTSKLQLIIYLTKDRHPLSICACQDEIFVKFRLTAISSIGIISSFLSYLDVRNVIVTVWLSWRQVHTLRMSSSNAFNMLLYPVVCTSYVLWTVNSGSALLNIQEEEVRFIMTEYTLWLPLRKQIIVSDTHFIFYLIR